MKEQLVDLTEDSLKDYFKVCEDVNILNKTYGDEISPSFQSGYNQINDNMRNKKQVFLIYSDVLINNNMLSETIFPELNLIYERSKFKSISAIQHVTLLNWSMISSPDNAITLTEFSALIFEGNLMFIIPDLQSIWTINISNIPKRSTDDSASEPSIRGPRDGLIEDISSNIALIRLSLIHI